MAELNIQQKNMINQLKQDYPELANYSDEQILSLYNKELNNIQLSEDEQISHNQQLLQTEIKRKAAELNLLGNEYEHLCKVAEPSGIYGTSTVSKL